MYHFDFLQNLAGCYQLISEFDLVQRSKGNEFSINKCCASFSCTKLETFIEDLFVKKCILKTNWTNQSYSNYEKRIDFAWVDLDKMSAMLETPHHFGVTLAGL